MRTTLDKLEIISKIISSILIPIVIGYMANEVNKSNKQKDVEVKLIELATSILNKEISQPQSTENKNLRKWGVDVINLFSEVKMDLAVKQALVNSVSFPTNLTESYLTWAIVFGGDKSLSEAQFEINRAKKIGFNGTIFLRSGSYRSVMIFETRREAENTLEKFKELRQTAYIVNMEKWCPNITVDNNIKQCIIN